MDMTKPKSRPGKPANAVMLCYVMLCYVMLCYVMLCYDAMLLCVRLWIAL